MADCGLTVALLHPVTPVTNPNPHIGLGMIGSIMAEQDVEVHVTDGSAPHSTHGDNAALARDALLHGPQAVGVNICTEFALYAYDLFHHLREQGFDGTIIAGGPHATLMPEEVLACGADIVVLGEGEPVVVPLVALLSGQKQPYEVPGIAHTDKGQTVVNARPLPVSDLDGLPNINFGLFDLDEYVTCSDHLQRLGYILTSRGCVGSCTFCEKSIFGRQFRQRSPQSVVAEIAARHQAHRVCDFNLCDDSFATIKRNAIAICAELERQRLPVHFRCIARIDQVDEELLERLQKAGCRTINYGVESGSDSVLTRMNKRIKVEDVRRVIKQTKKAGIQCHVNLMLGIGSETVADIEDTVRLVDFMVDAGVDAISQGTAVFPYPGTAIWHDYAARVSDPRWWLKPELLRDRPTHEVKAPCLSRYLPSRPQISDDHDFFGLYANKPIRQAAERLFRRVYSANCRGPLKNALVRSALSVCSQTLYNISPALEHKAIAGLLRLVKR